MKVLWDLNHDAAIVRAGHEPGALPIVAEFDGDAAVLHGGFHVATAIFDRDAAILGFEVGLTAGLREADAAILRVSAHIGIHPRQRNAAVVRAKVHSGAYRGEDDERRSPDGAVVVV